MLRGGSPFQISPEIEEPSGDDPKGDRATNGRKKPGRNGIITGEDALGRDYGENPVGIVTYHEDIKACDTFHEGTEAIYTYIEETYAFVKDIWESNTYDNGRSGPSDYINGVFIVCDCFWAAGYEFPNYYKRSVLGYDLVNEPLNGDYYTDAKLFEPGEADRRLLEPMYVSLSKVIREADPEAILMYEPAPFPDTIPAYVPLAGGVRPVGFQTGPTPGEGERQVLSYHIYSCGFATDKCDRKGDLPSPVCEECDRMADSAVTTREADARRLGGAAFLTEFGACSGTPNCLSEIHRVADMADRALHSWAYWEFKYNHDITTVAGPEEGFYDLQGNLQVPKVAALSRTYAPLVAGRTTSLRYDASSGAFRLTYVPEESTHSLKTEIYYNEKLNYPSGAEVHVLGGSSAAVGKNRVEVTAEVPAGAVVDVALARPSFLGNGQFRSAGGGLVEWKAESASTTSFELSTSSNVTWWKGLKVISDLGETVCDLQMQDATHGPIRCTLPEPAQNTLLFSYTIELWKAKELGIHRRVDVLKHDFLGPLLGRTVSFHWSSDSDIQEVPSQAAPGDCEATPWRFCRRRSGRGSGGLSRTPLLKAPVAASPRGEPWRCTG
ncbi:Endoglycoceramidase [Symbiodinium microadriaticum]|uniref:Endoglycoceramidase n=1 Tax=Symbiodinium microadriaticum TaxID=2951 RepID=A0A1Q9C713_SYMMI|nr:Endoglycoceramidase [Symbiodinium microadriaticum]